MAARDACRKRRLAPLEYVFGKPWLVLKSSQLDQDNALSLHLDCAAFILDISVEDMDRVDTFFESLMETLSAQPGQFEMPPCIAVLSSARAAPALTGDVQEEACEQLVFAQGRLHELGIDEVILKGVSASETHISVIMALRRLEHSRHAWEVWQADREKERAELLRSYKEQEKSLRQQFTDELWALVSDVDVPPVVPPVDASLPSKVTVGAVIGGLRVECLLGRGGFGTVFLAHNSETCDAEAVKLFPKRLHGSLEKVLSVVAEVDAMRALQHENVVAFLGVVHSKRHVLLRMQYAGPLTLMKYLSDSEFCRVPLLRARDLFRQLVVGMAYCHGRGIAHCDIKPENLGLDAGGRHLKVFDFGCAAKLDAALTAPKGTMPFMAPEVMFSGPGCSYAPAPADTWSMGVVLVEMAAGVGSVNQLMGWRTDVKADQKSGEDVLALLGSGAGAIRNFVHRFCGPPPQELAELLDATFAVEPGARATAARLARSPWVARPKQPRSDGAIRVPARAAPHRSADSVAPIPRPEGRGPRPSSRLMQHRANFLQDLLFAAPAASSDQPAP